MIVVDPSALIAILFKEHDARAFERIIGDTERVLIAAPSVLELATVLVRRRGLAMLRVAEGMVGNAPFEIVPFAAEHAAIATQALLRFGGRPAQLNFGDCMSYALAKARDLPLLYKGDDFAATDARPALSPA